MDIFYAIAEPTRRNILEILAVNGRLLAQEIYDKFSVSHSAISQHLKVLREAGLVKVQRKAQQRIYEINPVGLTELEIWTKKIAEKWEPRFDALDKLLEKEKAK